MEADEELLDEEDNFDGEDSPVLEIVILPTQVSLLTHFRMKNQRSQTIIGTKVKNSETSQQITHKHRRKGWGSDAHYRACHTIYLAPT